MKIVPLLLVALLCVVAFGRSHYDEDVGLFVHEENMERDVKTLKNLIGFLPAATLEAEALHGGEEEGGAINPIHLSPLAKKFVEKQKALAAKKAKEVFQKVKDAFTIKPKGSKNKPKGAN
jgi:hypothetical protein